MQKNKSMKKSKKTVKKVPNDIVKARKMWINTLKAGVTKRMNELRFELYIQTTKTAPQCAGLMNRFESPDSTIVSIDASPAYTYNHTTEDLDYVSDNNLLTPGFVGSSVTICDTLVDENNKTVDKTKCTFTNKKGYFTCKEMIRNILRFERLHRSKTKWFGGIDCHHVYYEGMIPTYDKKYYQICWGS